MQAPHAGITPRDERERFLVSLLDRLWERYRSRVEPARRYEAFMESRGQGFRNDHVAFRTIAWQEPASGIAAVARVFEALGYEAAGCYRFPDKKLSSLHFRHPNAAFPKLFVSELRAWELSAASREIVARSLSRRAPGLSDPELAALPDGKLLERVDAFFRERPWPAPEKADVTALDRESQFGAWVLVHGWEVNHFTGAVDDIEAVVSGLRAAGVAMKADIEGAPGTPLRQSSTEAAVIDVDVSDGGKPARMPWTYAYFELAQRAADFEGFLGPQATNLFDMTKYKR